MAQSTAITTYQAVGNRDDLTDLIATITRHETPLYSGLAKTKASGVYHEWQIDSLSTGSANAAIEGADFSFARPGLRTRLGAYCQIFTKTLEVAETQRAVSVAGLEDEFAYQMEKRMKEIATDIESALITATGNSGATGTARTLKGFLGFITTNSETGTGTATEYLTETMYNNLLQSIWAAGGRPDYTYVNGFQKRKISAFATNNTRYQEVEANGELRNYVSVYFSDFGKQVVELDPFMPTDKLLAIQKDMASVAVLRGITKVDVAKVGDSTRGALVGELCLEVKNEAAHGEILSLKTS